jgi:hypothetical protein
MGYVDEARARAKRRKSRWNFLLIPAVLLPLMVFWWATTAALGELYRVMHEGRQFTVLPDTIGGILMAVAPLFAWLAPSMILGNWFLAAIPPARRVLDAEASGFPGTDRRSAQRDLLGMSFVLTPVGLLVGLVGALIT